MATVSEALIPLHMLASGASAHVAEIFGGADQVQRIEELGLSRGTELQMVRSGSPCIIRVAGQTFCFRGSDLLSILVQPRSTD